jgi:hypothetical protein
MAGYARARGAVRYALAAIPLKSFLNDALVPQRRNFWTVSTANCDARSDQ